MAPTDLPSSPGVTAFWDPSALSDSEVERELRLAPLAVLARRQGVLVELLLRVPQAHGRIRWSWSQQDPRLTAQIFGWVEQARLHRERSDGRARTAANWLRDGETAAA